MPDAGCKILDGKRAERRARPPTPILPRPASCIPHPVSSNSPVLPLRVRRIDLRRVALGRGAELEVAAQDAEAHPALGSGLPGKRAAEEVDARRPGSGGFLGEGSSQRGL